MEKFKTLIEFMERSGWEIEKVDNDASVFATVGDFRCKLCYRPANSKLGTQEEVILLMPRKAEEIWALLQVALHGDVEVMRCREPINPALLGEQP